MLLSIALPPPPPETVFSGGLPFGAMEAVNAAYGPLIQVLDPPEAGFHLTIRLDLTKLAGTEGMYKTTNPCHVHPPVSILAALVWVISQ